MLMKKLPHIKFAILTLLLVAAAQAISPRPKPPPSPKQPWTSGATTVTASDGIFRVSGNGPMGSYHSRSGNFPQWASYMQTWGSLNFWGPPITQVIIEEGVTSIGIEVFDRMRELRSVTIPSSVMYISDLFYGKHSLTSITVAEDNARYSSVDGVLFNKDKTVLIRFPQGKRGAYTIPNSVTSIEDNAFSNSNLTSVTIPNSVVSIGNEAFRGSSNLISVTIPNSVTQIGYRAFSGCAGLVSVSIPGGVMKIARKNEAAIKNPVGKVRRGRLSNMTGGLRESVFEGCTRLASVTIGDGAEAIGNGMFAGCGNLTFITIPNSVTYIGSGAFSGTGLTSITIPSSVTVVDCFAFHQCSLLTSVIIQNSKPVNIGEGIFAGISNNACLYISASRADLWSDEWGRFDWWGDGWNKFNCVMPYNTRAVLWPLLIIPAVLILSIAIFAIIIKSRKPSGRKLRFFKMAIITLSVFLLLTIYLSVIYATTFSIKIETNVKDGGTVSPSGTIKYNVVTETIVTATANDGYVFTGWSGASTSTNAEIAVVVNGSRNQTLTANFERFNPRTVEIGNHTWMVENLNVKIGNSRCYDNDESNCEKYGRIYDWNTAMRACPTGWRLSSREDWDDLAQAAGGTLIENRGEQRNWATAGKNLKSNTAWDGTDEFGFSALPGGGGDVYGGGSIGSNSRWWTSAGGPTVFHRGSTLFRRMDSRNDNVSEYATSRDESLYVRCVRE